jgi:hypothetical protein
MGMQNLNSVTFAYDKLENTKYVLFAIFLIWIYSWYHLSFSFFPICIFLYVQTYYNLEKRWLQWTKQKN